MDSPPSNEGIEERATTSGGVTFERMLVGDVLKVIQPRVGKGTARLNRFSLLGKEGSAHLPRASQPRSTGRKTRLPIGIFPLASPDSDSGPTSSQGRGTRAQCISEAA